jgi:hypothetical protein
MSRPRLEVTSQKFLILRGPDLSCCPHHPRNMRKAAGSDVFTLTERQLEDVLRGWFNGLPSKIVPLVNPRGLPSDALKVISDSLATVVEQPMRGIFQHGYNYGVQELPTRGNAEIMAALTGPAEKYLRNHVDKQMIPSVSETVNEAIRDELAVGVSKGETIPELTDRVRTTTTEMSGIGAERIARTETADAFMSSREASWKESGVVWGKRWRLAPEACEFCEAAARDFGVQPLGVPFFGKGTVLTAASGASMKLDYKAVNGPPLHPNDRCGMAAVMEEPT